MQTVLDTVNIVNTEDNMVRSSDIYQTGNRKGNRIGSNRKDIQISLESEANMENMEN